MAIQTISGSGNNALQTVDSASNAARVTLYSSDGHEGGSAHPVAVASNDATALNEYVLPAFNAQDYKFLSIQLTGTWDATVTFEGSNNNATYYPIATTDPSANATGQTTATTKRIVKVPVITRYIQARVSVYNSGTVSAVIFGHYEENSSGLISTLGDITLNAETTKKIGNVGLVSGTTPSYQKFISATGLNPTSVKGSAANLSILNIVNGAATLRYFKLYNKASAPTVGTDVPLITITLPSGASNFTLPAFIGIDFSVGLAFACTLGVADSDTTPFTVTGEVTAMMAYS
tara:strand:+ start:61 stop:930 length:870 start_codon:yes stop_codon:yes gene_type:complete